MDNANFLSYAWGVAKLPGSLAYLTLRLLNSKETLGTALQRLGWSSVERRTGPVLWFNVDGIGETSTVLPVIFRCIQEYNEKVTVLVTTPCLEVYRLLGDSLPQRVIVQLVPLANPITISAFLRKWQPQIGVFLESPFHRDLAQMARESGVRLALLNAHMPGDDVLEWHSRRSSRAVLKRTLSAYSLIVPRTYADVGRFRMFGATLGQMPGWSTDLQQASELGACATRLLSQRPKIRRSLLKRLVERPLWIAANTLPGEDTVVARIHAALRSQHKGLLALVAPRITPTAGDRMGGAVGSSGSAAAAYAATARRLSSERRLQVELLSSVMQAPDRLSADVDILVLDDPDALTTMYSLSEIVLVGGSLLPSLDCASSPAAAAVAGCALLMGPHGGEYLGMASDLNHAAILASEEVAAAVAQTGATMRGINPSGFDTPREVRDPARGGHDGAEGVWQWPDRPAAGPADGATAYGGPSGSSGLSWQQLVAESQRPVRTSRPMSAPPTVPEHFRLRTEPFAERFSQTPFGLSPSYESSLHLGSSGPRGVFIAPFSTPGMSHNFGAPLPIARPGFTDQPGSAEFATPLSMAGTGHSRGRRRAIDRFRWASTREVIGFGYTPESDMDGLGSASSTCGSEEGEEQRNGEGVRDGRWCGSFPAAAGDSGSGGQAHTSNGGCQNGVAPSWGRDVGVTVDASIACTTTSEAARTAVSLPLMQPASPTGTGQGISPSLFINPFAIGASFDGADSDEDVDYHDAVEAELDEELITLSQEARGVAPNFVKMFVADERSFVTAARGLLAPQSNATGPTVTSPLAAQASLGDAFPELLREKRLSMRCGDVAASSSAASAPSEEQPPRAAASAAAAAVEAGAEVAEKSFLALETVGSPVVVSSVLAGAAGQALVVESPRMMQVEAPGQVVQPSPGAWRSPPMGRRPPQPLAKPSTRLDDGAAVDLFSLQGTAGGSRRASDDAGSSAGSSLPAVRGTHEGHLIICRDSADCTEDDDEGEEVSTWCLGLGNPRVARKLVSDPGLPATAAPPPPLGTDSEAGRGLSVRLLASPAAVAPASAAKLAAETGSDVGEACDSPSVAAAEAPSDDSDGLGANPRSSHLAPVLEERFHLRALAPALDECAMSETWASDVSMAALVDSPKGDPDASGDLMLFAGPSLSGSAIAMARESAWVESSHASFRGSLDHYLQGQSAQAMLAMSPPSVTRGRAGGRGGPALTRMSGKPLTTVDSLASLEDMAFADGASGAAGAGLDDSADASADDVQCGEARADDEGKPAGAWAADGGSGDSGGGLGDGGNASWTLLPLSCCITTDGESAGEGIVCGESSPTVALAAEPLSCPELQDDEAVTDSSPTTIAPTAGGGSGGRGLSAGAAAPFAPASIHVPATADSPKSDFEFGGSVPDNAGSGSPTLLATASLHNGSGANLQSYVTADGSGANLQSYVTADGSDPGSQQGETASQAGLAVVRSSSRTSSPSSTNSCWSDPPIAASPPRPGVPASAAARFPVPRPPPIGSAGAPARDTTGSSSPYEIGSCFADQTSFRWVNDGSLAASASSAASPVSKAGGSSSGGAGDGSTACSAGPYAAAAAGVALATFSSSTASSARSGAVLSTAASIGSRSSVGFYQVESIGGWLNQFGSMLPQPSLGQQRSQAQHDPLVWFSHRDVGGGSFSAAELVGVASGLRAPMHSPLRTLDDDRQVGIHPQTLASVTTALFPAAHVAPCLPPPPPPVTAIPASPRVQPRGAASGAPPSSPLRPASSVSSEQVTSAFTATTAHYAAPAAASARGLLSAFVMPQHSLGAETTAAVAPPAHAANFGTSGAAGIVGSAAPRRTAQDELSVLLNSPRSPVSPVRVARGMSPAADRRVSAASVWASPARPTALATASLRQPVSPAAVAVVDYSRPPPPSPSCRSHSRGGSTVGGSAVAEGEICPLPLALPSINTPRRELQRRQSAPVRRASLSRSPPLLPSVHSVVPRAAVSAAEICTWLERDRLGVAAVTAATGGSGGWMGRATPSPGRGLTEAAAGPAVGPSVSSDGRCRLADSPQASESSSCPNTPTSRAADNASSPFRGPSILHGDAVLHSPVARVPPMNLSADGEAGGSFEASFEAAVRAGPTRSPVTGPGSVHVSPYSSPYRSPFASAGAGSRSPGHCLSTDYKSLYLDEQEEEMAEGRCGLEEEGQAEDPEMPLSPRASSHNVLFSMQGPRDDEGDGAGVPVCAGPGRSLDTVLSGLPRAVGAGSSPGAFAAVPSFISPPGPQALLPSAASGTSATMQSGYAPARLHQLSHGSGSGSGATRCGSPNPMAIYPAFGSRTEFVGSSPTEPVIEEPGPLGFGSMDPISPPSGIAVLPGGTGLAADGAATAAAAAAVAICGGGGIPLEEAEDDGGGIWLRQDHDSTPILSRIPSLAQSLDEVEEGSVLVSPTARALPPLSADGAPGLRQPRITLSGGLLVVPAVAGQGGSAGSGGPHPLPRSHLRLASGPRQEDDEEQAQVTEDVEEEASMEMPLHSIAGGAPGSAEEEDTPRYLTSQPARSADEGSRRASSSSIASNGHGKCGSGAGNAGDPGPGSFAGGSASSLSSSSRPLAASDRVDSPPRSPAKRTRCPRSACPSASPVKPPLHSCHSSPVPRSAFATAGDLLTIPKLPYMPGLTSSSLPLDGGCPSPSSPPRTSASAAAAAAAQALFSPPPSAYLSPCAATDPRASPMKAMTAVRRTPSDPQVVMVTDGGAPRQSLHFPSPSTRSGPPAPAPFSSGAAASMAAAIFGPGGGVSCLQDRLDAVVTGPTFSGMAPLRMQPLTGTSAGPAGVSAAGLAAPPVASPRHPSPAAPTRQPWLAAIAAGGAAAAGGDDQLLATRASAPAGFAMLGDGCLPSTPRSGCRDANPVFSPAASLSGPAPTAPAIRTSASQALDLYAQRTQQQQAWDRARAESRNASAAGTPRSARALFSSSGHDGGGRSGGGGPPSLPVSFSSSGCGVYVDVCVSPVEAPRSPRVSTSPASRPSAFSLGTEGAAAGAGAAEDEFWQQQAQLLRSSASTAVATGGQGTARSARVLFPPASPGQQGVAVPEYGAASGAEPPSPKWSQASRRLFLEGGGAAASPAGTLPPDRRSMDQLNDVLAHMTVQVASPVSPQPRLPPPPASPRRVSPGPGVSATAADVAGVGQRGVAASRQRSNSPLVQTALLQQSRNTSSSGEQPRASPQRGCNGGIAGSPAPTSSSGGGSATARSVVSGRLQAFSSPGTAAAQPTQPHWRQHAGNSGAGQPSSFLPLSHLPLLPPLRQQPNIPGVGASLSCPSGPGGPGPMRWPAPVNTAAPVPAPAGASPDVESVRRQLFHQSAPQLQLDGLSMTATSLSGLVAGGGGGGGDSAAPAVPAVGPFALPTMPPAAEQEALAALESQFRAAEQEAAGLPIETRVVTPTALPPANNSSSDGSAALGVAGMAAAALQSGRPGTAPDPSAGRQESLTMAPPSPRAAPAAAASSTAPAGDWQPAGGGPGAGSRADSLANRGDVVAGAGGGVDRFETKQRPGQQPAVVVASAAAAAEMATGGCGPQQCAGGAAVGHGTAGAGTSAATGTGLKQPMAGPGAARVAEPGPSVVRSVGHGSFTLSQAAAAAGTAAAVECLQGHHDAARAAAGGGGGGSARRGLELQSTAAAGSPMEAAPQSAHAGGLGPAALAPGRTAGGDGSGGGVTIVGGDLGSQPGSHGGALGAEREMFVSPCARYAGRFLIPAAHVTCDPRLGPAVWLVSNEDELAAALSRLLQDSVERQSRGRAAAQGAAKLASSLVTTVWSVLEDIVIAPALQQYINSGENRVPVVR